MAHNNIEIPWIINIELTNACNLECVFCDHKDLKKHMLLAEMDNSVLEKIFSDIQHGFSDTRVYELGLVGLGEPTLARGLSNHLDIINQYAGLFERISFNSNMVSCSKKVAELLLSSKINAFTFSVNSSNPETYKKLMGRDLFDRVLGNLKVFLYLYRQKMSTARLDVQVFDAAGNHLEELVSLLPEARDLEVNFFVRKVYSKPVLLKDTHKLRTHKHAIEERYPCWDVYSRVYIDVEGNFYPCTIGNDSYRETSFLFLGNVKDASVLEFFNGEKINNARQRFERGDLGFPECETCNVWSLTPNNFIWNAENSCWKKKAKQVRAYGLKE